MKTYKRHLVFLKTLNLLTLLVIAVTVLYSWYVLRLLPEVVQVLRGVFNGDVAVVSKGLIWKDIRLMVTCYLLFSLITVFLELTPFRSSSGFHKAQFVSVINLGISLVFAYTIISTVCSAAG
jgi:hypothetical protein